MYETFLAKTITEISGLSDSELKMELRSFRRKERMNKMTDEDYTRLSFVEREIRARKEEDV